VFGEAGSIAVAGAVLLGGCFEAQAQQQPPQSPNMTFFVTGVGPSKGGDLGGKPALISTLAMEHVTRAYERSETKGFMNILVDRDSKQILGASFLGLAGDEVIHCVLDIMYAKAPYTVMHHAMHIHPTVSEFIPTMMGNLKQRLPSDRVLRQYAQAWDHAAGRYRGPVAAWAE
jgi:Pyridine nucleotide-disulphide oxidoreductase, dimerisation domain